ncbi:MAG: DMT family transporter [Desulfobacteraceae bacterium]|nr:DMT family transporter [Desulfobacteraceae bacterium]
MENKHSKNTKMVLAYAGLCLAVFFWAINTVIARYIIFDIKPMTLSFFRWFLAFIFILPIAIPHLKKDRAVIRHHLGFLFFLSIPSVAVYNSIIYFGAQYTTATNISLVAATMPIMTILFSWLMIREKSHLLQILGVMISFLGMVVIISKGSWDLFSSLSFNPGDLLIVFSIASWAFYSVMLKTKEVNISPISFLTVLICFGTLCILPFYVWEFVVFKGFEITPVNVCVLLYLGIFPSILSYICWNYGVRTAGASIASIFFYLLPIFTSIIAYLFLKESIVFYHFLGGALILAGLILSIFK